MKAQIQLCKLRDGQVDRQPVPYDDNETIGALIDRILRKTEDHYGPGCSVPLGKAWPNLSGWLEIRAYHEDPDACANCAQEAETKKEAVRQHGLTD